MEPSRRWGRQDELSPVSASVLPRAAPTGVAPGADLVGGRLAAARDRVRSHRMLSCGLVLIAAILLFAALGPLLIDASGARVGASRPSRPPEAAHLLGSDAQGRDVLAVLALATPETVKIALIAGVIGLGVGVLLGLVSGYFGGVIDTVVRITA